MRFPEHAKPELDFELNLAPIIDCFTVLMTYLLASASFLALGALDVSLSGEGEPPGVPDEAPAAISLRVLQGGALEVEVSQAGAAEPAIRLSSGDHAGAARALGVIRARFPGARAALVTAEDSVPYADVVRAVETVREIFPLASLGDRVEQR